MMAQAPPWASGPRRHCRDRPAACHRPRATGSGKSRRMASTSKHGAILDAGRHWAHPCGWRATFGQRFQCMRTSSWPISVEGLGDEGGDQHGLGFGLRDAARHQIEEMIVVEVAARSRHGRRPRRRRRFQARAWHRTRRFPTAASAWLDCLPSVFWASRWTTTLPWKMPRAFSSITHLKSSRLVQWGTWWSIDEAGIGMLLAAQQIGAGNLGIGALPVECTVPFWRLTRAPEVKVKSRNTAFLPSVDMGVAEMDGIGGFELDLDAVEPAPRPADLGDGIAEIGALAEMGFDQRGRGALRQFQSTLRVAMVRASASVAMKNSSIGVSMLCRKSSGARHRWRRRRSWSSTGSSSFDGASAERLYIAISCECSASNSGH